MILIEDPADLRYLTGLSLSRGTWIDGASPTLLVDSRYYDACRSRLSCSVQLESKEALQQALQGHRRVQFDSAISYERYQQLKRQLPDVEWEPIHRPLKFRRARKSSQEIEALRKSAKLTYAGIEHVISKLCEGVSELALAWEFEQFVRNRGASAMSFDPIIAFGKNSAYPHHRASQETLRHGDVVLIDVGAVVDDYHGDMTRVAFFGAPNRQLKERYERIQIVAGQVIDLVKPGVTVGALDKLARDALGHRFSHSLGHGVGLETHEFPRLKCDGEDREVSLEAGMVFTVEPGDYEAGVGGVRFEQMVLVTPKGAELLHE